MAFTIDSILDPFKGRPGLNKSLFLSVYHQKYMEIKEKIMWASAKEGNNYIVHVRVPSTDPNCKDVYYDVVFEFFPESDKVLESRSIKDYSVLIFSNCPSFTFSFTYACNKYGLLIDWLKPKCIPRCLNDPAVQRNPHSSVSIDTKTWMAAHHLQQIGILNYKLRFEDTITVTREDIFKRVSHQAVILATRQRIEERARERNRYERAKRRSNERFVNYREEKDYQHALERSEMRNKVNPTGTAHKLAKVARQARSARSARRPKSRR